jgi:hypothetical protein
MACAAPASWRAPSKAKRSTRSPTTSACPGRTLSTTCASRIRCRSRPKGKSGFGWSRRRTRPRTFGRLYHRCQTPDLENSSAILENFRKKCCQISHFGGEWCNGSTTDSDSVCLGSNPSSPATALTPSHPLLSPSGARPVTSRPTSIDDRHDGRNRRCLCRPPDLHSERE